MKDLKERIKEILERLTNDSPTHYSIEDLLTPKEAEKKLLELFKEVRKETLEEVEKNVISSYDNTNHSMGYWISGRTLDKLKAGGEK